MRSFITGSRKYGKPRANSDIDLVIFLSEKDYGILRLCNDESTNEIIRFANLNLIVCTSEKEFAAWKVGTERCVILKRENKKPTTKLRASKAIHYFLKMVGFKEITDPSGD